MPGDVRGLVVSVGRSAAHVFSKETCAAIRLVAGLGVAGDCHAGATVQHRSRVARDPSQANLRQVHLIHVELLRELAAAGFDVAPGELGENIMTRGVDLLAMPRGTRLSIGAEAEVELTGLRNPCQQIEAFRPGLMAAVLDRDDEGNLVRKAGVMAVVIRGGEIAPGDGVRVHLPSAPHTPLQPV
ncbi:MAG: MOSC domain-containing protein [Hyphomicrobiaceae bacterium]